MLLKLTWNYKEMKGKKKEKKELNKNTKFCYTAGKKAVLLLNSNH